MALIKDIAIGMSISTKDFSAKLKVAEKSIGSFGNAAGSLKGVLAGVAGGFAAVGAIQGISGLVTSGANLNAILSKTGVIFGDSAKIITSEADKVAASVGGIKSEFVDAATSFGSVFKGLGKSEEESARLGVSLAKLGQDLASFEGVSNEEAFTAISSALRGEFDPMEKFRVFLSADKIAAEALASGLAKTKGEIDEYAKKTATLNLILAQTTDAQGDLARTAGDADNQIKAISGRLENLKAEAGSAILPLTEAVSQLANSALIELKAAVEGNQKALGDWAAEAGKSEGLAFIAFEKIGGAIGAVADSVQVLTGLYAQLGRIGLSALYGLASAASAFGLVSEAAIDSIGDSYDELSKQIDAASADGWASDKITAAFDRIKAGAKGMAAEVGGAAKAAAKSVAAGANKMAEGVDKLESKLKEEIATFGMTSRAAEIYKLKIAGASEAQLAGVRTLDAQLTAKEAAEKLTGDNSKDHPTHAAALVQGSAEAYSAQLRFQAQGKGSDEPIKQVAKEAPKQTDLLRQLVVGLNKLGTKAGGAAAELFPI